MSESQDPQRRKDNMHTLNEWLGQEHKIGYDAGYKEGRKEGIVVGKRMQELESTGHTERGSTCELCREYQQLKEQEK